MPCPRCLPQPAESTLTPRLILALNRRVQISRHRRNQMSLASHVPAVEWQGTGLKIVFSDLDHHRSQASRLAPASAASSRVTFVGNALPR